MTGSGKAFCAGMDLASGEGVFSSNESDKEFRDMGGRVSLVELQIGQYQEKVLLE